jgi:hypothetical protein
MRDLTDDEIAEIGSTTGLTYLADLLQADDFNNCEQWLFDFARKCIAAASQQTVKADSLTPCPNIKDKLWKKNQI